MTKKKENPQLFEGLSLNAIVNPNEYCFLYILKSQTGFKETIIESETSHGLLGKGV